jgi:ABC-type transporter Mla subunit MlaD
MEEDKLKLSEEQRHAEEQLNKIKSEYDQLIKESDDQKQKLERQLNEVNNNLSQVRLF